jgi:FkbM family methyltransferase
MRDGGSRPSVRRTVSNGGSMRSVTVAESLLNFVFRRGLRGRTRLAAAARLGHAVTLTRVRTVDGLVFAMDPEAYLDGYVVRDGYYEREVLQAMLDHLPRGGVAWDVGANVGLHAVTLAALRADATVVAFEPAPPAAARLLQNAALNGVGYPGLRVLSVGLGAEAGYAPLDVLLSGNTGQSSFAPWSHVQYQSRVVCRVERADALVARGEAPAPDVVKIDVEGYESQVLAGMASLLDSPRRPRALVVESVFGERERTLVPLTTRGYRITPLAPRVTEEATNFLATA